MTRNTNAAARAAAFTIKNRSQQKASGVTSFRKVAPYLTIIWGSSIIPREREAAMKVNIRTAALYRRWKLRRADIERELLIAPLDSAEREILTYYFGLCRQRPWRFEDIGRLLHM